MDHHRYFRKVDRQVGNLKYFVQVEKPTALFNRGTSRCQGVRAQDNGPGYAVIFFQFHYLSEKDERVLCGRREGPAFKRKFWSWDERAHQERQFNADYNVIKNKPVANCSSDRPLHCL
jgi:hypothetical protein